MNTNGSPQLCRRMQLDLIPLYPADLDAAEAETVRDHAAGCGACAAELAVFAAQSARIAAAREGRRAPKLDLWEGVRAELAASPRGEIVRFPAIARRAGVAAAAAAAVLVGTLLAVGHGSPAPTPAPVPTNVAHGASPAPAAPGPAIAQQGTPPRHRQRPPRTFFQDEGSAPVRFAEDREVVPLNEESEVPTTPGTRDSYRHFEAEPGTRAAPADDSRPTRNKKKAPTSENGSLSF